MRDPTRHPRIGDRVYGDGESRTVISHTKETVTYTIKGNKDRCFTVWIMSWRDWCRNKNVAVLETARET